MILTILGYPYKLSLEKTISELNGNAGLCNFDRLTLEVAIDMAEESINSTLFHEIIEAVNYHLEIGLTEAQIKQLESGLHPIVGKSMQFVKEQYDGNSGERSRVI